MRPLPGLCGERRRGQVGEGGDGVLVPGVQIAAIQPAAIAVHGITPDRLAQAPRLR
ncbi:hypothetical protein GCM10020367_51670 [Streptomyces sannanensis]|uniref:Uncharacterized protein n=1 Tax=Streptomyces sannanensis TaxID=285536 RepID=A0ABP6SI64_9ACTN